MKNLKRDNISTDISSILTASHPRPFSFLGLHRSEISGFLVVRTFQPVAKAVSIVSKSNGRTINRLVQVANTGIFTISTRRKKRFEYLLKITDDNGVRLVEDPYTFPLVLSERDACLLAQGQHKKPYTRLGAHLTKLRDVAGVSFAVWAPNASHVAVVGDFNDWDGRRNPMRLRHDCGVWEIFIPALTGGEHYKFEIKDSQGNLLPLKADPFAFQAQYRPQTASIVVKDKGYHWQDQAWIKNRGLRHTRHSPISIYEVHLGSWKRKHNNQYLNYRELADDLIPYVKSMHFTHLQLMPVSEYPYDGSWGYQPVGLFAPTSRFCSGETNGVEEFQYFVDSCHQAGLGLLVDWVPGHFPADDHGLVQFDGTHLYEHQDKKKGFHPDWNTLIYNYSRTEVANFLRASAMHWLDRFHVDGIRVDAVASMLYLDYSRKPGEWEPNEFGGNQNLEAVAFIKEFNRELYREYPGTFSVAEESTSWPGVSKPTDSGGLGFGFKWNMGWMNDSLEYISRDPVHRKYHHKDLSFSLVYAFDENFVLPISHDEVVHGKGSMLGRMPGDDWQKFANLRAFYGFMWSHPGKKLLFMGCEFAQSAEWNFDQGLDWHHLDDPAHSGVQKVIKDLNRLYQSKPALYQNDCEAYGFEWIEADNAEQSIYAYVRYADGLNNDNSNNDKLGNNTQYRKNASSAIIVVCNFTPQTHHNFRLGVPKEGFYREIFNSDAAIYGGSNQGNMGGKASHNVSAHNREHSISITVPPLSTIMFEVA